MPIDLSSTWLLAAVVAAITIGALLKGITGAGLPVMAVPMLASITSVESAVVLMLLPGIAANAWLVGAHRRHFPLLKDHLPFLITGFIGGLLGTWLLAELSDRWLKLILAGWLGLYLYQYFFHRQVGQRIAAGRWLAGPIGLAAGVSQGASGISASLVAPYYHARGLKKEAFAFALSFTFLLLHAAQWTAIFKLQLMTREHAILGLAAVLPTLLFIQMGIRVSGRISDLVFNRLIIGLLIVMEIKLIFDIL
jgi:uncharacterized membrane protein YfcA